MIPGKIKSLVILRQLAAERGDSKRIYSTNRDQPRAKHAKNKFIDGQKLIVKKFIFVKKRSHLLSRSLVRAEALAFSNKTEMDFLTFVYLGLSIILTCHEYRLIIFLRL